MKKHFKAIIALVLTFVLIGSSLSVWAVSSEKFSTKFESQGFTIEKVSNPEQGAGEVDGILPFEILGEEINRYQSYAWSMAEYGDSIYIGTCWNPISGIVYRNFRDHLRERYMEEGMDYASAQQKAGEVADAIINVVFGGAMADGANSQSGTPVIIRVNKETNEASLVYKETEKSDYINWNGYRTAQVFNGKLYFICAGYPTSRLIQVDPEAGTSTIVLQRTSENTTFSSGIRGLNVFNGKLIVSLATDGADPDNLELSPALPAAMQEAMRDIAKRDTRYNDPNWDMEGVRILATDDPSDVDAWEVIANQETFDDLPACWIRDSINGGGIWDIEPYNGSLYVLMVTGKTDAVTGINEKRGFAIYKGDQTADGWQWTPFVGDTSNGAKYPFGMGLDAPCAGNLQTYDGYLYIGGYNDPMLDIAAITDHNDWSPLYNDLQNPVHLYRMDENGEVEEIVDDGFGSQCNQYVWNMAVYNDKLIIGTYDTSTLCSGITQLTDGSLLEMTKEEFVERIEYIIDLVKVLTGTSRSANSIDVMSFGDNLGSLLSSLNGVSSYSAGDMDFVERFNSVKESYEKYVRPVLVYINKDVVDTIDGFFNSRDVQNFVYYVAISDIMSKAEEGFDLLVSEDGINFEAITRNGFGDKYNHGAKALLATDSGFYVGTANPFWGTQLWKLTDGSEGQTTEPTEPTDATDPEETTEPTDTTEPTESTEPSETDESAEPSDSSEPTSDSEAAEPSSDDTSEPSGDSGAIESPATGSKSLIIPVTLLVAGAAALVIFKKKKS